MKLVIRSIPRSRKVSDGTDFSADVRNKTKARNKKERKGMCDICGEEKATIFDHIWALCHGGLSTLANCAYICGRCDFRKKKRERKVFSLFNLYEEHIPHEESQLFTETGKRKRIYKPTVEKHSDLAKKVHKAKMKARLAKNRKAFTTEENKEQATKHHKTAAKWRRTKKSEKDYVR